MFGDKKLSTDPRDLSLDLLVKHPGQMDECYWPVRLKPHASPTTSIDDPLRVYSSIQLAATRIPEYPLSLASSLDIDTECQ